MFGIFPYHPELILKSDANKMDHAGQRPLNKVGVCWPGIGTSRIWDEKGHRKNACNNLDIFKFASNCQISCAPQMDKIENANPISRQFWHLGEIRVPRIDPSRQVSMTAASTGL